MPETTSEPATSAGLETTSEPATRSGSSSGVTTEITAAPLELAAHIAAVADRRAGAVASFLGTVRDHDPEVEGEVVALEYSAHPDAAAILARLAAGQADRAGVLRVAVSHRVGRLAVGDAAIVAAVSTAHRTLAFDVCRELVERVKAELPVWKREILADGGAHWVGLGAMSAADSGPAEADSGSVEADSGSASASASASIEDFA